MLLFAISLIFSSYLLFQIQPMIGKYILPWFGSSPAVWSASLLFFQSLLTAGYAYAFTLSGRLTVRKQGWVHIVAVLVSLLALFLGYLFWSNPLLPDKTWQPATGSNPFWGVILVLLVAVGLPYFLLATNSTLLQAWYNRFFPGNSPYRLYALSNAASLIGLISYPFLFEPLLPISIQARWWTIGYLIFTLTILRISLIFISENAKGDNIKQEEILRIENFPNKTDQFLWILLPAVASILLLATTNQITQEIAVIPFLWILPLSLYLVSFILSFESDRWYGRGRFIFMLIVSLSVYGLLLSKGPLFDIRVQILTYCLLLFVCAMVCHGELAKLRPHPKYLTRYYLLISIGGAIGGLFVNLAAPVVFKDFWELPFGLLICFGSIFALVLLQYKKQGWRITVLAGLSLVIALALIANYTIRDVRDILNHSSWIERNFFGVLRVREVQVGEQRESAYRLIHGITIHGLQFKDESKRQLTTMYYTEASGVGMAFHILQERDAPRRIAVLGLGTGTLAAYGNEKDTIRFYEINPAVVRIAQGEGGYFTYLKDSKAVIEVVLGDARLSLEREYDMNGSLDYDLIVVDTFSSDSIPVHLLTKEAFELYLSHLQPDGILAVHISNIHLNLEPVVSKLAESLKLEAVLVSSGTTREGSSSAVWILLSENPEIFAQQNFQHLNVAPEGRAQDFRLWTDDYSNLFQILR
jgi:spermidine synthase